MFYCETHGAAPSAYSCPHVASAMDAGTACDVDYVFDDFGQSYLLCVNCLAAARQYLRSSQPELVEGYPVDIEGKCEFHVQEWSKNVNHVDLDALFEAAEKRTRRRPER